MTPTEPPPAAGRPTLWNVMVGAAAGATDGVALLVAAARGAGRRSWRSADVVALFHAGLATTAERGAAARTGGRRRLGDAASGLAITVATSALVNRVVDVQVDRILRPVVRTVLDDVLALLEAEPERVQAVVRSQRETIVDEVVDRVRAGTAAGDAVVDRWRDRVLRRTPPAPDPVPAPAASL